MPQSLHLLVVQRDCRRALVQWFDGRWLLPIRWCAEDTRAAVAIDRWARECGIEGEVAGQWLGRLSAKESSVDWLVVVRVESMAILPPLSWTSLASLTTASSLSEYQQWAIERVLRGAELPRVPGPFGSTDWLTEVRTWVESHLRCRVESMRVHRATAYEVVLEVTTQAGNAYFKGLSPDRAVEATITAKFAEVMPDAFAPTVALDAREDGTVWWLMRECRGVALDCREDARAALDVSVALARAQQRLEVASAIAPRLDLADVMTWACGLFERSVDTAVTDEVLVAIAGWCGRVQSADVPYSWIPLDLDPRNVVIDGPAVRFIDLDQSYYGPGCLACATFSQRCTLADGNSIRRAYERTWGEALSIGGVQRTDLDRVSLLIEDYLGWTRFMRNHRRGEVSGPLDAIERRIAARLAGALTGRRGLARIPT
jgi:hypothetical protein